MALATDFEGRWRNDGRVNRATIEALERLKKSGRKLVMVTGRELEDLFSTFSEWDRFDCIVAENGALVYDPATRRETKIAEPPPATFVEKLRERGVERISTGRVIVATWEPHSEAVLAAIHRHGLELQVIFNKGAVMVLPTGVNKASGLKAALRDLKLSPHNVVGVGDAENDHSFLHLCELSAAVANALPALKAAATFTTTADHGAGVAEIVEALLENDLRGHPPNLERLGLTFATSEGREVALDPWSGCVLICRRIGERQVDGREAHRRVVARARLSILHRRSRGRLRRRREHRGGGSADRAAAARGGDPAARGRAGERRRLHDRHSDLRPAGVLRGVVLGAAGDAGALRPAALARARRGASSDAGRMAAPERAPARHARERPARDGRAGTVESCGARKGDPCSSSRREFFRNIPVVLPRRGVPPLREGDLEKGRALVWHRGSMDAPREFQVERPKTEGVRHSRKYASAELTPDRSFYFRGPKGKLNLRADDLASFVRMAQGVDDDTWVYHLRRGEYSQWFRDNIKNEDLADAAERVEKAENMSASESRELIRNEIEQRYAIPA